MPLRPLLRPAVQLTPLPDGAMRLAELPTGSVLDVPAELAPLVDQLRGRLDAAQAIGVAGVDEVDGERLLRTLGMLGFLVGVDDEERTRVVEGRAAGAAFAAVAPFRVLTGTRFECGQCGACCRTLAFGPVSDEERAALDAADFVARDAELAARPRFELLPLPGEDRHGWFLARRPDGACVFLGQDGRCRVHVELGAARKPLACRVFPWVVTPTPEGIVVSDSTECATFTRASSAGPALHDSFDEVRELLRLAAAARPVSTRPVALPGGLTAPSGHARWVVARAVEVMDAGSGPTGRRLEVGRDVLRRYLAVLDEAPLGADLGGAVIAKLWTLPPAAPHASPEPDPGAEPFRAALGRTLTRVRDAAAGLRRATQRPAALPMAAVPGERVLELARRALAVAAGDAAAPAAASWPGGPLDDALWRGVRQRLHGPWIEEEASLAGLFARSLVTALAVVAGARALAAERGRAEVEARDLDEAQVAVVLALGTPALRAALHADEADVLALALDAVGVEPLLAGGAASGVAASGAAASGAAASA